MKLTRSRLRRIIQEELKYEDLQSLHQQGEDTGAPNPMNENVLFYSRTAYGGWNLEGDHGKRIDTTIGEMILDLQKSGVLEWYELTSQENIKNMLAQHEKGVQGGMERWDSDVFEQYYDVDVEWVIKEWAKLKGLKAMSVSDEEEEYYS